MKKSLIILLSIIVLTCFLCCKTETEPPEAETIENSDESTTSSTEEEVEPLTWLEEEIAHKWSRYHAYDGSSNYYIFKDDRSACYFEITSSGSTVDKKCYTDWSIDETDTETFNGYTAYAIYIKSSGITSYYSYAENVIYEGGYDNLAYRPSTTSRDCDFCD